MKALFHRTFNRSSSLKDKDGSAAATAHAAAASVASREKAIPSLPPLPEWPPPSHRAPSAASQTSAVKPLPDLGSRPLPPIHDSPAETSPTPETEPHDANNPRMRAARGPSSGSDIQKKVAFRSPPSTPSAPVVRPQDVPDRKTTTSAPDAPLKTTVSRLQAAHGATSSKTNLSANKATTTRPIPTPPHSQRTFADGASSMRSGSPFSIQSNNTSRILATASWSEAAEEDLVSNLGPRERTRQEVLWEIVASEERYVVELRKLRETFIEPLLHPFSSTITSPTPMEQDEYHGTRADAVSPHDSAERLPIAARFLSPTPSVGNEFPQNHQGSHTPIIDGESSEEDDRMGKGYEAHISQAAAKLNHPRSPYRGAAAKGGNIASRGDKTVPFPSRSHHSLPPPPRVNQASESTTSLGRQSYVGPADDKKGTAHRVFRKLRKSQTGPPPEGAVPPHLLPDDLRRCLEVLEGGILSGHDVLAEGLRKRYDEQYPLVRSLADVFVSNSHILREYATYVLHLERALEQVDDALSTASAVKKPKKQTEAEWMKVCKLLQRLEEVASDKGETGLAISLSKPFQRLLKYPLLFQNLLFHTDPSTFEYESTLQMVAEVETIVRSIEDEKIQKEERDRTRDVFARIEGLDKVKQLAVPKPSRLLVEEKMLTTGETTGSPAPKAASPSPSFKQGPIKGKSSFRRLSDVLQSGAGSAAFGGRKDLWLVVFNDVVLRCQRTGTTSLPLATTSVGNARSNSLPDLQVGKSKYATTGRRNSYTKPRNLYKFIKIETWAMVTDVAKPRAGIVSMEDISRSRALVASTATAPSSNDRPEDDDPANDSDESDRKSKMSFSYWGADKVTLSHPPVNTKGRVAVGRTTMRGRGSGPSSYTSRESSANAKFGTRLVHNADSPSSTRPASRKAATPSSQISRKVTGSSIQDSKATTTSTRRAWDGNTRTPTPSTTATRRPRNLSQSSSQASGLGKLASPAPSEDSGVGLYRQMLAQDPSLNT